MTEAAAPRIAPLPPAELGDDARAAFAHAFSDEAAARFFSTDPEAVPMPNVLATLLRHPGLAGPFLTYNNVLLRTPVIEPRLREIVILRVAARTRANYEWAQHVRIATGLGVTEPEIDAIADEVDPMEGTAVEWTPLEATALAATDQLVDRYRVDDGTWARLAEHLDVPQLIELVFVVGTYTGLAMAFNSFGLQLDPELRALTPTLPEVEE